MSKPKRLAWGKSPFDDMDRDELLFWACRMYAACNSARSVLAILRGPEPYNAFWCRLGSGYEALQKMEIVVGETERRFDSESIYRMFYRYAVDLLFPKEPDFGWHICKQEGCGQMIGRDLDEQPTPSRCHSHPDAGMRPITWDDLKPTVRP